MALTVVVSNLPLMVVRKPEYRSSYCRILTWVPVAPFLRAGSSAFQVALFIVPVCEIPLAFWNFFTPATVVVP